MFGFLIASFKADYITLKVGINNLATLGPRTYPGCCIGLVRIIREACPSEGLCCDSTAVTLERHCLSSTSTAILCKARPGGA
jgi:hypothetical protein